MALETLKDVKQVNGHGIIRLDKAKKNPELFTDGKFDWAKFDEHRKKFHISIADTQNMISFKIQDGPIKENGHNGCQVDEIVSTALLMIKGLNKKFPSDFNVKAMTSLYEAYSWLQQRKHDREIRGVEGQNKA